MAVVAFRWLLADADYLRAAVRGSAYGALASRSTSARSPVTDTSMSCSFGLSRARFIRSVNARAFRTDAGVGVAAFRVPGRLAI